MYLDFLVSLPKLSISILFWS